MKYMVKYVAYWLPLTLLYACNKPKSELPQAFDRLNINIATHDVVIALPAWGCGNCNQALLELSEELPPESLHYLLIGQTGRDIRNRFGFYRTAANHWVDTLGVMDSLGLIGAHPKVFFCKDQLAPGTMEVTPDNLLEVIESIRQEVAGIE